MTFYVALSVIYLVLVGLWLWAVAKWTGLSFPVPDIVLTAVVCNLPALFGAVGALFWGWILGLIFLGLIVVRVEDADPWPELALMAGGTVTISVRELRGAARADRLSVSPAGGGRRRPPSCRGLSHSEGCPWPSFCMCVRRSPRRSNALPQVTQRKVIGEPRRASPQSSCLRHM